MRLPRVLRSSETLNQLCVSCIVSGYSLCCVRKEFKALAVFKTKCTEASLPLRDWTPWFYDCALRRYIYSLNSVSSQRFCKHEFIVPLNRSLVVRHQNRLRWLVVRTLWGPQRSLAELLKTPSYPTTQPVGLLSQVAHSSQFLSADGKFMQQNRQTTY
jgi:hypothetical protein